MLWKFCSTNFTGLDDDYKYTLVCIVSAIILNLLRILVIKYDFIIFSDLDRVDTIFVFTRKFFVSERSVIGIQCEIFPFRLALQKD